MASLLNANYWKKAYLLEFKMNNVLTDAFTFSVPPESEEFSFPQRNNETKTFGGSVIADYGNDTVQINLSGSTINQELKLIFKSTLGTAEMTGEQEIFYLRDLLKKYGTRDKLQNKEVYLYSLSGGGKIASNNPKWWKIYVGQLDITRSKDKPFCYNYKFNAIGAPEVTKKSILPNGLQKLKNLGGFVDSWVNMAKTIVGKLNEGADYFEALGADYLSELSGYISSLRSCIDSFDAALNRYSSIFSNKIEELTDVAIDTIQLGDKVIASGIRLYPTVISDVWNSCQDVVAAGKKIYNYVSNMDTNSYTNSAWQSVKEMFDSSVSDVDISDAYSTIGYQELSLANEAATITCKNLNSVGFAVIPGSANENDRLITTYGYKVVALTDAETNWDQLAQDYYGDASLSALIATYNNLPTDKPLKAGQSILIPNLNFAENTTAENEVYNSPDEKDNYGKDLLISDKDFSVYNGDVAVVDGVDNLEQALLNRYSTLVGARIRVEAYGIQATIGDAVNATSALIQASVHQTTVEDPRVDSVEDISFQGKGDNLTVSVTYIDKNGAKRNFGGTI